MPTSFVDYAAIKAQTPIDRVIPLLELQVIQEGEQWRGPCPACRTGGSRALVITPSKSAHYCFAAKRGGDVIALVAHIRGTGQKEAALWLMDRNSTDRTDSTSTSVPKRRKQPRKPPKSTGRTMRPQLIQRQQEQPDNVVELRPRPKKRKAPAQPNEDYSLMDWLDDFN